MEKRDKDIQNIIEAHNTIEQPLDVLGIVYDAIESTISAIIITDNRGVITYVNNSFLTIFDYKNKSEVLGMNAADIFQSNKITRFSDVKEIIQASNNDTGEFSVTRKNGETFFVEISFSDVTNSNGDVVGKMASLLDVTKRKTAEQEKEALVQQLKEALEKIKTLRGLIPICASCKNIRDDKGFWHRVDSYIERYSEAQFSHGLCPECEEKLYGQQSWYKKGTRSEEE